MTTNLASAVPASSDATPAATGCPVHWVADLATSEPAEAPVIREGSPDPKEVREFFELYKKHSTLTEAEWRLRVQDVVTEIAETGTYTHTNEELTVGARLAWRHNTRCIGKLYWRGLTVRDFRDVTDAAEIAEGCLDHGEFVFNKGRIKPSITIFAPSTPGTPAAKVWNGQLISYAGHRQADGTVIGDPHTVAITDLAKKHGWAPAKEGLFDILPLVIEDASGDVQRPRGPARAGARGRDRAPDDPGPGRAGPALVGLPVDLRQLPVDRRHQLSVRAVHRLVPGAGDSARDFTDTYRYNLLPEIAEALGIDTSDVRSLWKDKAVLELTTAVLHSFDKAGIRMDDHHTAAQKFHKWTESEERKGCPVEAEWAWMVPPISASLSPNFHREFEDVFKLPALIRRPALES